MLALYVRFLRALWPWYSQAALMEQSSLFLEQNGTEIEESAAE
jgi:hypothetical protein